MPHLRKEGPCIRRTQGPLQDATTLDGMLWAAYCVLKLRKGGTAVFEPECGSWINLTRYSTKRTIDDVLGDESVTHVLEANTCAAVVPWS